MYIHLVKNKLTVICTVGLQVILAFFYLYCLKLLLTGIHCSFWKKEKVDLVQMCSVWLRAWTLEPGHLLFH